METFYLLCEEALEPVPVDTAGNTLYVYLRARSRR